MQLSQIKKAQPTVSEVHINAALTNISIAFIQQAQDFIADRVFPVVPVQKQADAYFIYDRGDWFRSEARRRAPGTESAGSGWDITTDTYFAHKYAIHKDVSDDVRANADAAIRIDSDATEFVTQQCMLIKEITWAASYFVTGVWTTEITGVAAAPMAGQFLQWDQAGSTPIVDLRTQMFAMKELTGFMPNKLTLGPNVWSVLQDHPDFLGRVNSGQTPGGPAVVNRETLAAVLELDEVLIAWGVQNTATEGATESNSFIAGNNALLTWSPPSPSLLTPSAGYTFAWAGLLGAGAFGNRIKRFRMEPIESDRVECELAFDTKVVSADLGSFLLDAVS